MKILTTRRTLCTLLLSTGLFGCMAGEETEEDGPVEARGILYRGQVYTPEQIQQSGLQINHLVASQELEKQGLLAGFDSPEESSAYLLSVTTQKIGLGTLNTCGGFAHFYEYTDFGNPSFYMGIGEQRQTLDNGWNDNIASLRTPVCLTTTILYKDSYFGGRTLFLGPGVNANLKDYRVGTWDSWRDDASSIKVVGNFDYSATDTASATQRLAYFTLNLNAGQTIDLGTCSVPSSSGNGDTYLRLVDPNGNEVASSDDGSGCGYLSSLSYTATTSGTFEIRAGCWGSGSCNGRIGYTFR